MSVDLANPVVQFLEAWPKPESWRQLLGDQAEKILIIADRKVARRREVKTWLKAISEHRPVLYEVSAGESLKDINAFPKHVRRLHRLAEPFSPRSGSVIALGGGTVGDFAGFFASVYKRGVPLVHIPTTLLSALDSAHGGKNGLNIASGKNQIGTFYAPRGVLVIRELLAPLPRTQMLSAAGELAKMALIVGGDWLKALESADLTEFAALWQHLPRAVAEKLKIVAADPLERLGQRQALNLGHTLGHALESEYGLAHGHAVGMGLGFALRWSEHRGYLSEPQLRRGLAFLEECAKVQRPEQFLRSHRPMRRRTLGHWLAQDKKLTRESALRFVFLEGLGQTKILDVPIESVLTEAERQGWARS